jgi:alpha-tubulin suppressor-like RCC1 family protein
MKLHAPWLALAGALAIGGAALLFACVDAEGTPPTVEPAAQNEAGADARSTSRDAGAPPDAEDELVVPSADVVCDGSPCAVSISGAGESFCALLAGGTVACWGRNDRGQLGYDSGAGFPQASAQARLVPGVVGATHVSVGSANACARLGDGGVVCWGAPDLVGAGVAAVDAGTDADAGDPEPPPDRSPPTPMTAVPAASSVAVGDETACVTTTGGALACWGKNDHLELGRGPTASSFAPPAVVDLGAQSVLASAPGTSRTFALATSGALLSWGAGQGEFLLGRDTSEDPDPLPAAVTALTKVRAVASSATHACAVAGRLVSCWGENYDGELGRGTFGPLAFLPGATNLAYVVAGEDADAGIAQSTDVPLHVSVASGHTCAVMGSGRVYCWGTNASGQLGDGVTADRSGAPRRVSALGGPAVHLASADNAVCALLRTGSIECWGANFAGQLGRGDLDGQTHPLPARVVLP